MDDVSYAITVLELEKLKAQAEFIRNRFLACHCVVVSDEIREIEERISKMMSMLWTEPHKIAHDKMKAVFGAEFGIS